MDARKHLLLLLLSAVAFLAAVEADCNNNNPLIKPEPDEDFLTLEYKDYIVQITLHENYPTPTQKKVRIAHFNCDEKDEATIDRFVYGSQSNLELSIEKEADKSYLVVNKPQDYEISSQQVYRFFVKGGARSIEVSLTIINLDDESPTFALPPDSKMCAIRETEVGQSSCFFLVNDPDGMMDNMKFTVLEGEKVSENISLVVVDANDPDLCQNTKTGGCLVVAFDIKQYLEFIDKPVYSLLLQVEDGAGHIGSLSYVVQVIAENKDIPHFTPQELSIEVVEGKSGIISTSDVITVSDRDSLEYGQFYLTLEGNGDDECYKAFEVIPSMGYRNTEVKLSVTNPEILDYDEGICKNITVKIIATEVSDASRIGEAKVNVKLIDRNDESPIFVELPYEYSAYEHTAIGTKIGSVKAIDKDATDNITYTLPNSVFLQVDPDTGNLTVIADFSINRQPQIFATVRAEDSAEPPHFDYAQIVVNVLDVNDMMPVLFVPLTPVEIEEGTEIGTQLNVDIRATDEDANPDLSFYIDWENSRAAKQGFPLMVDDFTDCLTIETLESKNPKEVKAVLRVNKTIDWEVFDTLYVNIIVEDNNTEPEYQQNRKTSAMLTITIKDINDCYPEFSDVGILTFKENTQVNQLFGIILATDQDGPGNNEVKYRLYSTYDKEYVTIHETSGELRTGKDPIDFEKIEEICYTVVASDGTLETRLDITIQIGDVNDNTPYFVGNYNGSYKIPENNTERMEILQLKAQDDDKSPEFNTLRFFRGDLFKDIFEVDNITGEVYVPAGKGTSLDYEKKQSFNIDFIVRDRCEDECYTGSTESLFSSITITVELTDINDNPPKIQSPGLLRTIPEDEGLPNVPLGEVRATDADSGDNAYLTFEIVDCDPKDKRDLFDIIRIDANRANVVLTSSLLNKWGDYTLKVNVSDTNFSDIADFTIVVTDINNNDPKFEFPTENDQFKFNIFNNTVGNVVSDVNGVEMAFNATDPCDKGDNGTDGIKYYVIGDATALRFVEMDENELRLYRPFEDDMERMFKLQIKACDGTLSGNERCSEVETDVIMILNKKYEPTFKDLDWETHFTENSTGLAEVRIIDVPVNDRNDIEDCHEAQTDCGKDEIYYFIYGEESEYFKLNKETGELSLKKELDREVADNYTLVVVVTNYMEGPPGNVDVKSQLSVTIKVNDVIDTAPKFGRPLFAAGINIGDKVADLVTTFVADFYDLENDLSYHIIENSMSVTDNSLQHLVNRNPFNIANNQLRLNFDVQDIAMTGTFKFKVQVINSANLTDEADCQVYIISNDNIVSMRFNNTQTFVDTKRMEITSIYTEIFGSQSNVRKVARALNSNGVIIESQTDVTSYFVDDVNKMPIKKDTIEMELTNKKTLTDLQDRLLAEQLVLDSIGNETNQVDESMEGVLQIVLIVVSVVLGTLVILLFAAFFIRTRSLNRRLEALSTTKFGSQDSGLNRVGMSAPNTNQHAVEGSNPIWGNEEIAHKNFDNVSISSGDSDLIGVEDNPEFSPAGKSGIANDGFTPEPTTERRVSLNPMFATGLAQLSAAALQEKSTVGRSVNPLADMQNNDAYHSDTDSRRSSEIVADHNPNFTFYGTMGSMPTTDL